MDISDKFQKVWVFLTQNGFIPVLKKLSVPPVSMIELDGISGEQSSHDMRQRCGTTAKQQVGVVGYEGPGIAGGRGFREDLSETHKEIITVLIIPENLFTLNPPDHDMMEGSGRIDSGLSGHEGSLNDTLPIVNF